MMKRAGVLIGVALGLLSCSPFKGEVTCNDVRDVEYDWRQVELLDVSGDVVPEEAWAQDYAGIVTYTEKGAFDWQWLSETLAETPVMSQPVWPPRGEREKPVVYSPRDGGTCYLRAPVSLVSSTLISYSGDKRIEDGELVVDPGYERVYEITLRARGPIDDVECVDQSVDVEWVLRLEIDEEGLNPVRGSCHHD